MFISRDWIALIVGGTALWLYSQWLKAVTHKTRVTRTKRFTTYRLAKQYDTVRHLVSFNWSTARNTPEGADYFE